MFNTYLRYLTYFCSFGLGVLIYRVSGFHQGVFIISMGVYQLIVAFKLIYSLFLLYFSYYGIHIADDKTDSKLLILASVISFLVCLLAYWKISFTYFLHTLMFIGIIIDGIIFYFNYKWLKVYKEQYNEDNR